MSINKGTKVRLTREKCAMSPPARAGDICIVQVIEGFGCYILRGPIENPETENRLFAATEGEFQEVKTEAAE